jgi:hypothetical protein
MKITEVGHEAARAERDNDNQFAAIRFEPSHNSTCESCGLPGHALRKVPDWPQKSANWKPKTGDYPFLGPEGVCECGERLSLYPADEYADRPLCGTCYGQVRSIVFLRQLHETQRRLGLTVSDELHVMPAVAYKIPGVSWCCSVRCLECVLFGPGRCRECGTRLGEKMKSFGKVEYDYRAGLKFCELCAGKNHQEHGLGERLLAYLRKYEPSLVGPPPERKRRAPNRSYLKRLNLEKSAKISTIAL